MTDVMQETAGFPDGELTGSGMAQRISRLEAENADLRALVDADVQALHRRVRTLTADYLEENEAHNETANRAEKAEADLAAAQIRAEEWEREYIEAHNLAAAENAAKNQAEADLAAARESVELWEDAASAEIAHCNERTAERNAARADAETAWALVDDVYRAGLAAEENGVNAPDRAERWREAGLRWLTRVDQARRERGSETDPRDICAGCGGKATWVCFSHGPFCNNCSCQHIRDEREQAKREAGR